MASEWGDWAPIIEFMTPLLMGVATIMLVVGGLVIQTAAGNEKREHLGWGIVKGGFGGYAIGALAQPLYMLFVGF